MEELLQAKSDECMRITVLIKSKQATRITLGYLATGDS